MPQLGPPNCSMTYEEIVTALLAKANEGCDDAVELLRSYYDRRLGITPQNEDDVLFFISLTPNLRRAFKQDYPILRFLLDNSPNVPIELLERKIFASREESPGDGSSTSDDDSDDDSDVTSVTSSATASQDQEEEPTEEETESEASWTPTFHNRESNFIQKVRAELNLRLILLLFVVLMMWKEALDIFLKIGFYVCYVAMMWWTWDILHTRRRYFEALISSGMLPYFPHRSIYELLEGYFRSYTYFFSAFITFMLISCCIPNEMLSHWSLHTIPMIYVFASFVGFRISQARASVDLLVLASFSFNILAKYLYETNDDVVNGYAFPYPRVPIFLNFVFDNDIKLCVNCRAALYLIISLILVRLASRYHWHGIYMYLMPHCVTLAWLRLGITTFQRAVIFRLVRTSLLLSGFWTIRTIFELVLSLIPVLVFFHRMSITDPATYIVATLSVATVTMAFFCYLSINRTSWKPIIIFQLVLCLLNVCLLNFPYMAASFKGATYNNISEAGVPTLSCNDDKYPITPDVTDPLNWDNIYIVYGAADVQEQQKTQVKLYCSHLNGMGNIAQLGIDSVENIPPEHVTRYLLVWLGHVLRCFYDAQLKEAVVIEDLNPTCSKIENLVQKTYLMGSCVLGESYSYECDIQFRLPEHAFSGKNTDGTLRACYELNVIISQNPVFGDRVKFYEILQEGWVHGFHYANIKLLALNCPLCDEEAIISLNMERLSVSPPICGIIIRIKYILEVIFNPLIKIKAPHNCF